MAFKSVKAYNENRYRGLFILKDDCDWADVIFLYRSYGDVMKVDAHYIKSSEYSGYIQCCESGCPACNKGIRIQTKLFIPLYNIQAKEIQFFDRTMYFEPQLSRDVFSRYPNPSEFVFRITRHGIAGSRDTTYSIEPVGTNKFLSYDDILKNNNVTFPEYYNSVCAEFSSADLSRMLNSGSPTSSQMSDYSMPDYQVTPRPDVVAAPAVPDVPVIPDIAFDDTPEDLPEYSSSETSESVAVDASEIDNVDF